MNKKCRVENCGESVYGAISVPTEDQRGVELWYYCKIHYELYSFTNKIIDKFIGILRRKNSR